MTFFARWPDSPGLVYFAIEQVNFFEEFKVQKQCSQF